MKTMQATDAKNRFGELLEDAISEPVLIQKNGRDVAVVMSKAEFDQRYATIGSDGAGGAIVTWSDRRDSSYDGVARRPNAPCRLWYSANRCRVMSIALCSSSGLPSMM